MTSEVLILNKRAAVIAADSAITSSGGEHPRYSKAATKIFDLSNNGSVAAAFFGNAIIDSVPWEVAIKLFRAHVGSARFPRVADYMFELLNFLSGNDTLFPPAVRNGFVEEQFDQAVLEIIKYARSTDPTILDAAVPLQDRQARWAVVANQVSQTLVAAGIAGALSANARDAVIADHNKWVPRVQQQLAPVPNFDAIDPDQLADLGHRLRYARPDLLLSKTGLVVAGYGDTEIFPSYTQVAVYGHVGDELCVVEERRFEITHAQPAMIQPLAQTSMIDTFTDGFGPPLASIISDTSLKAFQKVIDDLAAGGHAVPQHVGQQAVQQAHADFMLAWKQENWRKNYTPLMQVLATLQVQEMAHLAESLLGLESLKERVTSPREEVGGPIDVAVITKAEGLVWIKRKHYFDSDLNLRYAARVQRDLNPN